MEHYALLELRYQFGRMEQVLNPVVLLGAEEAALIDCGYPGSLVKLEEQMNLHGLDPTRITRLVLTHQDDDHMGAAGEWLEKYPKTKILASMEETPYLEGSKKNLRLAQAERMQEDMPEDQRAGGEQFCAQYRALKPIPVSVRLRAGDIFDWGGGCEILETPGHMPGHISIRALDNSFLVTGDAAVVESGALAVANPGFCLDLARAEQSLAILKEYDCPTYLCYHGGMLKRK